MIRQDDPKVQVVENNKLDLNLNKSYLDSMGKDTLGITKVFDATSILRQSADKYSPIQVDNIPYSDSQRPVLLEIKSNEKTKRNLIILQAESLFKENLTKTSQSIALVKQAEFRFKSLSEARRLATVLSNNCPNSKAIVLGLTELMINAVEHGNLGIGYDDKTKLNMNNQWETEVSRRMALPSNKDKYVSIQYRREINKINFIISDQGRGFDWKQYMDISPQRIFDSHGRGIAIANLVSFDQLEYLETGNKVSVTVSL